MEIGFDSTLPTGRDLSRAHDRIEFRVRESSKERLDRYLLNRLGWKSRNKVQRLIQLGRVTVNDEQPKASRRIARGDVIRISIDPGGDNADESTTQLSPVLWEDPFLVAVDKPPHRLVHPVGRTVSGTIVNELHHAYRAVNERGLRPIVPKLCHRLDRDTSGLLLVAKCDLARRRLSYDFEHSRVSKTYLAIVEGSPSSDRFEVTVAISAHLDRDKNQGHRLARADESGKSAETRFEVVQRFESHSLVRCHPITGRQNQIRIHLAHAGVPILGDVGYGSSAKTADLASLPFPDRALLHSCALEFLHPVWRAPRRMVAPVPSDFSTYLCASDSVARDRDRPSEL